MSKRDPKSPKRDLRSVLRKAPGGEFALALWDWEGGIMGKILIGVIALGGLLIYLHFSNQQTTTTTITVAPTNSSNSPITQVSQSSNVTVKYNSENPTVSVGGNNYGIAAILSGTNSKLIYISSDTNAEHRAQELAMYGTVKAQNNYHGFFEISLGGARITTFDPSGVIFTDGTDPVLWMTIKNERLLVSAEIRNEKGELVAELRDNEWKLNQDLIFDRNYNDLAVEVRDRRGKIVLQLANCGDVLHFEGVLTCKNGHSIAWGRNMFGSPDRVNISPIFEYPSNLHFGSCPGYEALKKTEPPVRPGQTGGYLITKPIDICP